MAFPVAFSHDNIVSPFLCGMQNSAVTVLRDNIGFVKVITKLRFRRKTGVSDAWLIQAWWLTLLTPALVSKVNFRTFKAAILRNLVSKTK